MLHLNKRFSLGYEVDSAGTASYHVGAPPDPRTIANAHNNGIDLLSLRARQISTRDLDYFDLIYAMDKRNLADVLDRTTREEQQKKVSLLMDVLHPGENIEVPDPYYGSPQDFEKVFQMIFRACDALRGLPPS